MRATMLYDMCLLAMCILAVMDNVCSSRPRLPSQGGRRSRSDILKEKARTAALLMRTTDDEDILLPNDDGSGWALQRDKTSNHRNIYTRPRSDSCCRVGKIAGSKGSSCNSRFYVKQMKAAKSKYRLYKYRQRLKHIRPKSFLKYRLMNKFQKCAIRRRDQFSKCCHAAYFNKLRRDKLLRYRKVRRYNKHRAVSRYKRKRRRHIDRKL